MAHNRGRVGGTVKTDRIGKMTGRVQQGGRSRQIIHPNLYPVITGDDKPFDPAHLLGLCPTAIIFGANHFASKLPDSSCWLVWDKNMNPDNSFSDAELMWTNMKGHLRMYRHTWSGLVREGTRDVESLRRLHPTQKPVGLLEQVLRDFSKGGDVVVDPYLGSGSTLIVCERLGRVCFGMEIEPAYVQVAVERWEAYTGRHAVKV